MTCINAYGSIGQQYTHTINTNVTYIQEFEVDGEKVGVVRDFVFLGAKIEDSGSCKGEILRRLALGRAAMTGLKTRYGKTKI